MSETTNDSDANREERGWRFWLIFVALCSSLFLSAIDLASVATALPKIVHDLGGTDSFAWVSAAYTLACTAILPFSGKLANIVGRRFALVSALTSFTIGSILCGAAPSMNVLIAGRAIQGIGSGGIQSLVAIIIGDLVPLSKRGLFISLTGSTWAVACAVGPFLGGAFAQDTTWRWLFYINLPLCAFALVVVIAFLHLRVPAHEGFWKSLLALDWIGNTMIIGGSTSVIIALTWAGVRFPWSSPHIIIPLTVGLAGLLAAVIYEVTLVRNPTIPGVILASRTGISGYIGTFLHGGIVMLVLFYLPVYFQAVKLASPLRSGLYIAPLVASISPAAVAQGIIINKTGWYKLVNLAGWALMLLGIGLLRVLTPNSSIGLSVPMQIAGALGLGLVYSTQFVVLAPIDPEYNAQALSFLIFVRSFAQSWSVAIGASILQNHLKHHLPPAFLSQFAANEDISYTAIPSIPSLPEPLRSEVRGVFADGLRLLWTVGLVVCAFGFLSVFLQKNIPLHQKTDERWGMKRSGVQDNEKQADEEKVKYDEVIVEQTLSVSTIVGVGQ